jgi:hypothetical protein
VSGNPTLGAAVRWAAMWPIIITVVVLVPLLAVAWWRVRR